MAKRYFTYEELISMKVGYNKPQGTLGTHYFNLSLGEGFVEINGSSSGKVKIFPGDTLVYDCGQVWKISVPKTNWQRVKQILKLSILKEGSYKGWEKSFELIPGIYLVSDDVRSCILLQDQKIDPMPILEKWATDWLNNQQEEYRQLKEAMFGLFGCYHVDYYNLDWDKNGNCRAIVPITNRRRLIVELTKVLGHYPELRWSIHGVSTKDTILPLSAEIPSKGEEFWYPMSSSSFLNSSIRDHDSWKGMSVKTYEYSPGWGIEVVRQAISTVKNEYKASSLQLESVVNSFSEIIDSSKVIHLVN